ncbi:hypothetical protein, partial [Gilvimarinus sp. 1_MG-2023]
AQGDASDPAERLNNGYLIKPIRDRKLLDMVARVLQLQWQYDDDASELSAPSGADPVDMTLSEAREMLAAAEVGHIVGMEAVLEQMEQRGAAATMLRRVRHCLSAFRFDELITLTKKVINDET